MTKLNHIQAAMLDKIAEATMTAAGFAYVKNGATAAVLVAEGFAELNASMIDGDKIAARATEKGIDYYQNGGNVETTNETVTEGNQTVTNTTPAPNFAIETGVAVPPISRSGAAASIYPFDLLEVGQSFFVPATDDMPNPGKSLASTVSSASKRYATQIGTKPVTRKNRETGVEETVELPVYHYDRKFMVRTVDGGARVWRIEPKNDDGDDE